MATKLDNNSLYLMHLISCAPRGEKPMALPQDATWDAVFRLASRNSVAPTCAAAVQQVPDADVSERQRWQQELDQNLMRHALFDLEREGIFAAMDNAGLAHLPLKGVVISREYPRPEMRWMCDNDILFGRLGPDGMPTAATDDDKRTLRRLIEGLGYKTAHFGMAHHDTYEKPPFINMEMHHGLVSPGVAWASYYANPWQRARKDSQAGAAFSFSHEDSYLFCVAHMYKHFSVSGHGVRGLADEWVLLQTWGPTMDRSHIDAELNKLGMAQFEADLVRATESIVGKDACGRALAGDATALAATDAQMLAYMLGSGTYGTVTNRVRNELTQEAQTGGEKGSRARYVLHRIFPSRQKLMEGYPVLKRAPWLQPGVYLYRLVVKPFTRTSRLRAELAELTNKDGE